MNINLPSWIWVLTVIFIILLITLFIYIIIKSKTKKRLTSLFNDIDTKRDKIEQKKILKKFEELKKFKVTNTLNDKINNLIKPKMDESINRYNEEEILYKKLKDDFNEEKIFKLEPKVANSRIIYKELLFNVEKISKDVNSIFEEEKQNREIVDLLSIKLNAFKETYLDDNEIFYYSELSKRYNILNDKYKTIENSNDNEYDYLVETSKEVYETIKVLEDKAISYPEIYEKANIEFEKLSEVNELFEKLLSQNYDLTELNFETKFNIVSNGLEELIENLINLKEIDSTIVDRCSEFVEDAYLRFEDEISSKENINRMLSTYEENVANLEEIYSQFCEEITHITKYEINEEISEKLDEFKNNIKIYIDRYYNVTDTLSQNVVEYSWANDELVSINDNIVRYIEDAKNYVSQFRQIRKDEINAISELHKLNELLNETIFESLVNKISIDDNETTQTSCRVILKRLATQLQSPKINIDIVNELLTQSISIISDYKINVSKQIKMQKIAKKTSIYANRYRKDIADNIALNMSMKLIKQGMYKKAIENIYKIINKYENIKDITLFIKIWEERI